MTINKRHIVANQPANRNWRRAGFARTVHGAPNLQRLDICHLPQVTSLEPLAEMKRREYLSVRTLPSWAGIFHFVKTLKPIASLKNEQAR